ncbi:MAG: hypothetical protein DRP71_12740 [Verrucomicrobia bacterium]|nr:MAG: hypothetical protein DRP71_12740 [Verrucomicrobiota bacterium]
MNDDRSILRNLAERQAEIAGLPIHTETIAEWKRLNANKPGRPMVWINEIPWHEMDVDGELTLQCSDPFCRSVEETLRRTLYQWNHMRGDMVVEARFDSPLVIHDSGFGIDEDVDIEITDHRSGIVSREFHNQIDCEKDIEKIRRPVLSHDEEASEKDFQRLNDCFGDILTIEKTGIVHRWFAPWDELIRWWDVQQAMMDLILRPELVHMAMDRLVTAHLCRLGQWRELNLLTYREGNHRVGSGGMGLADELPSEGFDPDHVRTMDQWGCATAQIFCDVSPEMHEEFALQYERRWLEQFGLNYYGCCEPLHGKVDILRSIPRLRKISTSPWADVAKMVENTGSDYVLSHKPTPAIFAEDAWNPEQGRRRLSEALEKADGVAIEVIMKDISTVRNEPRRLWEWAEMAMDLATSGGVAARRRSEKM